MEGFTLPGERSGDGSVVGELVGTGEEGRERELG